MRIVETVIARPIEDCWRGFNSPGALTAWVPGLREAIVLAYDADGRPAEIQFEFGQALIYALLYTYDVATREVRWEPRPGEHGAVRGYARFEEAADGTRLIYALAHEPGRKAAERAFDDPRFLVEAFARWMHERRR